MKTILGIDPGLTKTGWGIISVKQNNISYIASGTIHTDAKQEMAERLNFLHQNISQILSNYKPDEAAIEETFVNKNPVSSLKLGQARGAIILSLSLANIKIAEYASTSVKKAVVGVGRAEKHQVGAMIKILLPKSNCKSEDEADALAVAICHNNNSGYSNKLFTL
jgi:crossover junction endodeoxyribonuclease RuvC